MGNCVYCKQPAGFLLSKHEECRNRHERGRLDIIALVSEVALTGKVSTNLKSAINQIALSSHIGSSEKKELIVLGWEDAVNKAFEGGFLSEEEEKPLFAVKEYFSLSQDELDNNGAFTKVAKGCVSRDILEGKFPERIHTYGMLPFNLQKAEKLAWVFKDVEYYEVNVRVRYLGGSQKTRARIAKDIYYRAQGFNDDEVQMPEVIHADTGLMGVTNKHIYFSGPSKKFRIDYDKIVTFDLFADGIGVQRDTETAKPQVFVTDDGEFTYNLITNLAQMQH